MPGLEQILRHLYETSRVKIWWEYQSTSEAGQVLMVKNWKETHFWPTKKTEVNTSVKWDAIQKKAIYTISFKIILSENWSEVDGLLTG